MKKCKKCNGQNLHGSLVIWFRIDEDGYADEELTEQNYEDFLQYYCVDCEDFTGVEYNE